MTLGDDEPDNLRADLEASITSLESGGDTADSSRPLPDPVASEAVAKSEASDATTATEPGERARGPDGKFIPKTEAEPAKAAPKSAVKVAPAPPAKTELPSTDTPAKASDAQSSTAANAPPVGWTADAKAEWDQLSPAIKAAVLKREVEISSGGAQWSAQRRQYEEMIAPVQASASRRGMSAAQGIQALVSAQNALDTNPVSALEHIARTYGLSITVNGQPGAQAGANGSQPPDGSSRTESPPPRPPSDPRLDAIWAWKEDQDRRESDMTLQRVTTFATDPAHPHFDAVSDELMAMLPLLKASNPNATPEQLLQDAYDRAVYANPLTRAAIAAEQAANIDAERRKRNSADVGKAKLASVSLRGTPPAGSPAAPVRDSIREELEAAFAR